MEEKLTTPDVVKMFGCHKSTAEKWAVKNRLEFIAVGAKHFYLWGTQDIERFASREKPGRRRYKDAKKTNNPVPVIPLS
jgi:hypothetical protein